MSIRPKTLFIIVILVLLSLALVACERERPPATTVPTTVPRGTVAPSPTPPAAVTAVTLPRTTGATDTQATPGAVIGATPTAPAPQTVVVSPGGQPGTDGAFFIYTVRAGDYLAAIAERFNTTSAAIVTLNAMTDPDALIVGQQLKIPGSAPATSGDTTPTTTGQTTTYTVVTGDTLAAIAQRFGTTVEELVRLNNIADANVLSLGQQLTVPAASAPAPATGGTTGSGQGRTYVVQGGDTLLSIARRFGVTLAQLQTANNLTNPDRIYVGQKLVIP